MNTKQFEDDRSAFVTAYSMVALSGGIMGLFLGWIIWG